MSPPVFAVAGWKNSGKTTLVERLVRKFTERGFAVATVKRSHDAFLMDVAGTDTDRHREAGARAVVMAGPNGWTLARTGAEPSLDTILADLTGYDIIVVEGYKASNLPIVEVVGSADARPIRNENANVFAIASDEPVDTNLPVRSRDDIEGLAALTLARFGLE